MEELVAVDRNHSGEIISFKTSSGRVVSYRKALQEIEAGTIAGAQIIEANSAEEEALIQAINQDDPDFNNFPPIF